MNTGWKIRIALAIIGALNAVLAPASFASEEATVAKTRAELRQQGFKTDLTDFNFTTTQEMRNRLAALSMGNNLLGQSPRRLSFLNDADLMTPVGEHTALVLWKQERLANPSGFVNYSYMYDRDAAKDVWPVLRGEFDDEGRHLDAAAGAALSGPIRFDLITTTGPTLLRHLPGLKYFVSQFGCRAMLALHDGEENAAWTNLLAATRIVTAWEIEPVEISQTVRFRLLDTAYRTTWEALQAGDWSDERLSQLQREWETFDVFKGLADAVAYTGAEQVAMCQQERLRPAPTNSLGISASRSLSQNYNELTQRWADMRYREHGTYVDENDMLLFYRDRQLETRRAIQSGSWAEMRLLPGVTNQAFFQSRYTNHSSPGQMMMRSRRIAMAVQGAGLGTFARAAEAEAERRNLVTAIALERFHGRHASYPKSLAELIPDYLKAVPIDFMDGHPLRYALTQDGHFFLYSTGLDCVDDGGKMPPLRERYFRPRTPTGIAPNGTDLVWPAPASTVEAKAYVEAKERQTEAAQRAQEEKQAQKAEEAETSRKATVERLLSDPKFKKASWPDMGDGLKEPVFKNQPLSKAFHNESTTGTHQISLDEMLTLKQVITGGEPAIITYELPMSYDFLKNGEGGSLNLSMDASPEGDSLNEPEFSGCERATNGDCLLAWNTTFSRPGQHALQAALLVELGIDHELTVKGPVLPYLSTNLCWFFEGSSMFSESGVPLSAQLPESNGVFSIEIKSTNGEHLKTLTGSTSNGMIDLEWDLVDEQGHKCTNNSIDSFFTITLPASGRSQTLRQPQNKVGAPTEPTK